jgi:hypothetical protein
MDDHEFGHLVAIPARSSLNNCFAFLGAHDARVEAIGIYLFRER